MTLKSLNFRGDEMGRISERVNRIYNSQKPLTDKIARLVYYGWTIGFNSYNFDILIDEIKKYNWDERL